MSPADAIDLVVGFLQGATASGVFVVALFIGFCVVFGFLKNKRTAGGTSVIKSLDETISHKPFDYLSPSDPRGPADQLRAPELLEAAARK